MPGGKGNISPKDGVKFSSKNQPSAKAKSEGRKKAIALKKIASQLLTGGVKEAMQELATYMGLEVDRLDVETAMHLKQIEKAVKSGDTTAYNAVMDRISGKPTQSIQVKEEIPKTRRYVVSK